MPFCLNCGKEVPAGAKFCGNCGTPVQETGSVSSRQAPAEESRVFVRQAVVDPRPEGIRLLVWLCLLAAIAALCVGCAFIALATGKASAVADLGIVFVILGVATFVVRFGYSNATSWGRIAGIGIGVIYALLGLFLLALSYIPLQVVGAASLAFGATNLYYMMKSATKSYFNQGIRYKRRSGP